MATKSKLILKKKPDPNLLSEEDLEKIRENLREALKECENILNKK